MFKNGNWKCKENDDLFSLSATQNADEYEIKYVLNEKSICEVISIYFIDKKYKNAKIFGSIKFGDAHIFIFNDNRIEINNRIYIKTNEQLNKTLL